MRVSKMFMPTLREVPAEAEIESHKLMLRAGLIRKLASGIYTYLPLGLRTFKKIEQIIREEMDNAGAQELFMSALVPAESYRASGRWDVFGPEIFKLKDRNSRDFCLGPTHEEIFTEIVKNEVKSYKALPLCLYQIQTKFRDERRPRFGVMRSREFAMKDAYSFDRDENGLDLSYMKMYEAYRKIFDRCGLKYSIVSADSGAMGGSGSQEFMVNSKIGEAIIIKCSKCDYAANDEKAVAVPQIKNSKDPELPMEKVATPNVGTISELVRFFDTTADKFAKTLIYKADGSPVAVMLRGDREVNETKLKNLLGCSELEMADFETVAKATGAEVGFAGPIGLKLKIYADVEVSGMKNFIVGANETGYHYTNVNVNRDFKPDFTDDLRNVTEGDICPVCGAKLTLEPGIEVGHIFKLGTKYSDALGCKYLDETGTEKSMVMGSYGIGLARTMAAVIEQNNDENGIVWPDAIAPYQVIIIPVNMENSEQVACAEQIYEEMAAGGVEVLLDDRNERAGVKFKDADLIGIPLKITVGRKVSEGIVEFKKRRDSAAAEMWVGEAVSAVFSHFKK